MKRASLLQARIYEYSFKKWYYMRKGFDLSEYWPEILFSEIERKSLPRFGRLSYGLEVERRVQNF